MLQRFFYQQAWHCSALTLNLIQSVYVFDLIDRFNHVVMPCASHHHYDDNTLALSTTTPLRPFG